MISSLILPAGQGRLSGGIGTEEDRIEEGRTQEGRREEDRTEEGRTEEDRMEEGRREVVEWVGVDDVEGGDCNELGDG